MSLASPNLTPVSTQDLSSPKVKGFKKVFSSKRKSSEVPRDTHPQSEGQRDSIVSLNSNVSPNRKSAQSSPNREDGSSRSGSSGVRKLLPGHSKRQRRKIRDEELKAATEELERGRKPGLSPVASPTINRSVSSLTQDADSLLTDDSEPEVAPPLLSRDSHVGYLTTTSPLIRSTATEEGSAIDGPSEIATGNDVPTIAVPDAEQSRDVSPSTLPASESTPALPSEGHSSPVLIDRADSLRAENDDRGRRGSMNKLRAKSPARRFKDVFSSSKSTKSPKTSPERKTHDNFAGGVSNLLSKASTFSDRMTSKDPEAATLEPAGMAQASSTTTSLPALATTTRPETPPGADLLTPVTTITPPTPTLPQSSDPQDSGSPQRNTEVPVSKRDSGITVSPSGNMISHRKTRSQGSITHAPSKLSSSVLPPLTPTVEEVKAGEQKGVDKSPSNRNVSQSFFSSWVSAAQNVAQNAASNFSGTLNNQNRSRSSTTRSEDSGSNVSQETARARPEETAELESPKKQLAVETMGSGDLDFSHLGIDGLSDEKGPSSLRPDLEELRKNSTVQRDEADAKIEDILARQAVSAAYDTRTDQTPIAELPDPLQSPKHGQVGANTLLGDQSPPNGSIFGDDTGSIKRSNSMRSRMAKRRSRGSSVATGASTIGAAIVSASTTTLANPATGPRLSGFATAPKQRNRAFHQQFRSVPDDDYLIEDYSCALQREILLAGRIYISEGHICFSSNILGWVTTLVISFEEVVSIERETTAMVFPNAIAIQTLHTRHTFRSLLSREATFDLMIGIWKVSHPASFKKSVNGKQLLEQEAAKEQQVVEQALATDSGPRSEETSDESGSEDSDDEDGSGSGAESAGSAPSVAGDAVVDSKSLTRKPSGMNSSLTPPPGVAAQGAPEMSSFGIAVETAQDFPGPPGHPPTDCTDASTHYEKIIKDEVIPAPLGKVYSLLYGTQSSAFVRKYLLEEQKALDLQLEDDKTGLTTDKKSRQYQYIKPLGGSIGPKQTKCITTENLDFFDLEKSVSVTCSTQTPDVPSGSAFSVKTRYCLSWAPGNATRLQMNCGIEWTAKSWLKGPIEKGANDGQQSYGDGLVKVLRGAVETRRARDRGATGVSKSSKKKKKRTKHGDSPSASGKAEVKKKEDWGLFEPVRGVLQPFISMLGPLGSPWTIVGFLLIIVFVSWLRAPRGAATGLVGYGHTSQRIAAYEEMWKKEESELWDWLEDRVGVDGLRRGRLSGNSGPSAKQQSKERKKILGGRDVEARLKEEKMGEREMEEQIRVTQERLALLQQMVEKRKRERD